MKLRSSLAILVDGAGQRMTWMERRPRLTSDPGTTIDLDRIMKLRDGLKIALAWTDEAGVPAAAASLEEAIALIDARLARIKLNE